MWLLMSLMHADTCCYHCITSLAPAIGVSLASFVSSQSSHAVLLCLDLAADDTGNAPVHSLTALYCVLMAIPCLRHLPCHSCWLTFANPCMA